MNQVTIESIDSFKESFLRVVESVNAMTADPTNYEVVDKNLIIAEVELGNMKNIFVDISENMKQVGDFHINNIPQRA